MDTVFNSVGPYEIVGEIGRGGMATVFLATDTRSGRRVALKLVPSGTDREAREILEAEQWGAKLQERFCASSRYVPEVYEHGTGGGYFYIAMEYLEGENLSDVIARGPLAPERAIDVDDPAVPLPRGGAQFRDLDRRPAAAVARSRRSEAQEHPRRRRQRHQGARLRDRQSALPQPQGHAQRLRHLRVPVARVARLGRQHRLARRPLGGRRAALRDGCRPAGLRGARHTAAGTANPIAAAGGAVWRRLPGGAAGDRFQAAGGLARRSLRRRGGDSPGSRVARGGTARQKRNGKAGRKRKTSRRRGARVRTWSPTWKRRGAPLNPPHRRSLRSSRWRRRPTRPWRRLAWASGGTACARCEPRCCCS